MLLQSSYQKSFGPKFAEYAPTYQENLTQRYHRRDVQSRHSTDAFEWPQPSWEADSENGIDAKHGNVPVHKYKHDLLTQAYKEKLLRDSLASRQLSLPQSPSSKPAQPADAAAAGAEEGPPTPPPSRNDSSTAPQEAEKKVGKCDKENQAASNKTAGEKKENQAASNKTAGEKKAPIQRTSRPKKPGQTPVQSTKSAAQQKQSQQRPKTALAVKDEVARPPFFIFALQDREPQVSVKKTYNVKSPVDVHQSALKALQLRQDGFYSSRRPKSADPKSARKSASFTLVSKEDDRWATEYRKHFHGFEKDIYERVLSARQAISRPLPHTCTNF